MGGALETAYTGGVHGLVQLLKTWVAALADVTMAVGRWLRQHVFTDDNLAWVRQSAVDLAVAIGRALSRVGVPSGPAVKAFFRNQVISTTAGWTAGLLSASLVNRWFVRRSVRNLWGLAARGDRTVVSGATFEWLATGTSFVVGLAVLIAVRHLVHGTLEELHDLQALRALGERQVPAERDDAGPTIEE